MKNLKATYITQLPPEIITWVLYTATDQQLEITKDLIDHTLEGDDITVQLMD